MKMCVSSSNFIFWFAILKPAFIESYLVVESICIRLLDFTPKIMPTTNLTMNIFEESFVTLRTAMYLWKHKLMVVSNVLEIKKPVANELIWSQRIITISKFPRISQPYGCRATTKRQFTLTGTSPKFPGTNLIDLEIIKSLESTMKLMNEW